MVKSRNWRMFALFVVLLLAVESLPIAEHLHVINTRAFWVLSVTLVGVALFLALWEVVALVVEWHRLKKEQEQLNKISEYVESKRRDDE